MQVSAKEHILMEIKSTFTSEKDESQNRSPLGFKFF